MKNTLPAILWTPSRNQMAFGSPLAAEALSSRIHAAFGDQFRGRVENNGVKVWRARDFAASRGSFAPLFYGTVTPADGGSRLSGHFQMHPITRLYVGVWIGLTSLLATIFLVATAQRASAASSAGDALPVLFVALLPLAGLLLVRLQQQKGQADEEAIKEWIETVLTA